MKSTVRCSSSRDLTVSCFIFAMYIGSALSTETTTKPPVNKGAARQMFGSGNLRQAGNSPVILETTTTMTTTSIRKNKEKQDTRNNVQHEDKPAGTYDEGYGYDGHSYEGYGGYAYGGLGGRNHMSSKTHSQLPAGFYENPRIPVSVPGYDLTGDVPSYRNGAPVNGLRGSVMNGVLYDGGRSRGFERAMDRNRGRGGLYGGFEGMESGYVGPDRSRIRNNLRRGHGVGPLGDSDVPFETDRRTLIMEEMEEEERDTKDDFQLSCGWICERDQFMCDSSCTCISADHQCDGQLDCDNGEDEIGCHNELLNIKNFNVSCPSENNVRCPDSGMCIYKKWLCDGDDDCGDYSDESHCGTLLNCTYDQFECRNGLCIHHSWVCDGDNDCNDNSDEVNCYMKIKCNDDEFKCENGACISKNWRCDSEEDCKDGSDELKCQISEMNCAAGEFQCRYSRCIKNEYRCDGNNDCGDFSDEENCSIKFPTSCNSNDFRCTTGECISKKWVCDKEIDCKNGEDEVMCEHPTPRGCSPNDEFTCSTGTCVPRLWVCDGVPDCSYGEDEQGCAVTCEATQYLCKSSLTENDTAVSTLNHAPSNQHYHRYCIGIKHVCDGMADCPEEDDELNCPRKRNCTPKDKCTQQCILTADNLKACACEPGFILGPDNATCHDINECEFEKDPVCSQLCNNTLGSFTCGCMTGYVLRPDLRTCKALGAKPTLLFANRVDIRQVTLGNSKYTSILKGLVNAIALDFHYKRETVYWSDISMDVIRKVFINGTKSEDVVHSGLEIPGGIAIDWIHNLLFWTDSGTRRVEVVALDSKMRHVLISSDLDKPRAIAVHPNYGYVYWSDWGPNPKIERADMDGSGRVELITESIFWPNGLTIDYTTDRIFWADAKHHVIESAYLDGTDRKKVVSKGLHHPFAITIFEDNVYWTDWRFKSITSANKGNGLNFKIIHSGLYFPMDIHSYHPQRQPDYANHCGNNNGKCSHMCLPNSTGYSCVCPVGLKIKRDGKNCASTPDNLLIFARKKDLRLRPIDQSTRAFDTVIPVDHVKSAVALTWDAKDDTVYWTDVEANSISKAYLNGTNQSVIIADNLESPAGLAMDWITNKLYWTDAGTNRIECSNLDGSMRTLLIYEGLDRPRDLVVDPTAGYMYWSDWGEEPEIERASMDGTLRKTLIGVNLTWPNGLAIDFQKKRLYWADGGTKKIEYSDLDGNGRTVLISTDLPHPFGLVIFKNKIYWTDWDTQSIHQANKDTGLNRTIVRSGISGLMDVRVFHRNRQVVNSLCNNNNGNCSHLCLLTPVSPYFKCACPTGLLSSDGKTCPIIPTNFLVFAHRVDIRMISFDIDYSVNVVLPISHLKNASGVDVDRKTGDVYWTDAGQDVIKKASFDGKSVKTIIDKGIETVDSLVLEPIGRKLYWTDAGLNSIEVSELDGSNRKVLVWSGLENPRAITLHYPAGLMYWSDWGKNGRIERANMDGKERTTVIADDLVWPNGLTVDITTNKLYWNDAKRKIIEYSDLNGEHRITLINNALHPYGLTVMNEYIFWTDWQSQALFQANKITGMYKKVVVDKLEGLMDVRAIRKSDMYAFENVCANNNGGCSHLCLRNPGGYSCACPTGILINDDNMTCATAPSNFLLLTTKKTLARVSFDTPEMWEVALPIEGIQNALSVDFHWEKQLIIYTDIHLKIIRSVNMRNHSDTRIIFANSNTSTPCRIAVDWIANNIYWIDTMQKGIEVARLDGRYRKKVVGDLKEPRSLTIFPQEGYIYWTEWNDHAKIERSLLDGSCRKVIISTDLAFPNGLSIDYENKMLYWADALKDRIEMSNLHGKYRVQLVPEATYPFGLTQYGDHVYWTDWQKEIIEQADKVTGRKTFEIRTVLDSVMEVKAVSAKRQTGWNPCADDNGGCSHLCFYVRKNYKCACPDEEEDSTICSTVPTKQVPLQESKSNNNNNSSVCGDDDTDEDSKMLDTVTRSTNRYGDNKFRDYKFHKDKNYSLKTMMITTVVMVAITFAIVVVIIYLLCQRKTKQKKYPYPGRRNVLTFSNPNYNASSGDVGPCNPQQDKKLFIWKRLKYDKSQERVYEDNGQTSSPEVVSLIPPSATPSSSRAPSVTPRESSPPLTHATYLNG